MTLIKSISGFRGTIGGTAGDNFTPIDIVESAAAFGEWLKESYPQPSVVIGRDGRSSGPLVQQLVSATLQAQGIDVIDIGQTTTPTAEVFIPYKKAAGGIMISASHNPMEWNALKFFNADGEFISADDGKRIIEISDNRDFFFVSHEKIGSSAAEEGAIDHHIREILNHRWVNPDKIRQRKFKIVADCINSTGSISMLPLLEALNCEVIPLHSEISGTFAHDPEPLVQNLTTLIEKVKSEKADLGIAVDPDVDRVAFVDERGEMFGEEYTIVAIADYLLDKNFIDRTVSNLSSSRALKDVTRRYDGEYYASAVGEVNVVTEMKKRNAVFGGEGNGGVIAGDFHYGRDALIGIALFLSGCVHFNISASEWKQKLPPYEMAKVKVSLPADTDPDKIIQIMADRYREEEVDLTDGLKIDFPRYWVHIRKSNTEPVFRIYTEAGNQEEAKEIARTFKAEIQHLC